MKAWLTSVPISATRVLNLALCICIGAHIPNRLVKKKPKIDGRGRQRRKTGTSKTRAPTRPAPRTNPRTGGPPQGPEQRFLVKTAEVRCVFVFSLMFLAIGRCPLVGLMRLRLLLHPRHPVACRLDFRQPGGGGPVEEEDGGREPEDAPEDKVENRLWFAARSRKEKR